MKLLEINWGLAPVTNFVEAGYVAPTRKQCFIPDELWVKVLPFIIKQCCDAQFWFLDDAGVPHGLYGTRKNEPAKEEYWYVGGGPKPYADTLQGALCDLIERETGVRLTVNRIPVGPGKVNYMRWARSVSPLGGAADVSLVWYVQLTKEEADQMIAFAASGKSPEFSEMKATSLADILASPDQTFTSVYRDTISVLDTVLRQHGVAA